MRKTGLIVIVTLLAAVVAGAAVYMVRYNKVETEQVALTYENRRVEVTPADKMRVRTAEGQPSIDINTYRLSIKGLVEDPFSLSFQQIIALPAEERYVKLPCVEGWTEAGVWKGTKLSSLLERAGVKSEADNVVFSSPGGYTTSLTLADIKKTDPLLAYGVNGSRLPDEQGYPLRLVVPDRLGYKWIKWVVGIEVVKGPYQGYWESRGYSNDADASGR